MKTYIVKINNKKPEEEKLKQAAEILKLGGIVVIPTDTVYGLAVSAFNIDAQKKIYELKGRSFSKPLIIMASDVNELQEFADVHDKAHKIMKRFWPGPLTLVFNTNHLGQMLMGGRKNFGVRIPKCKVVTKLIKYCGFPIATTSANYSSKESAKTGKTAKKYFNKKVDLIFDSGKCDLGKESTVIDMTHFPFTVIREGSLPSKSLLDHL